MILFRFGKDEGWRIVRRPGLLLISAGLVSVVAAADAFRLSDGVGILITHVDSKR